MDKLSWIAVIDHHFGKSIVLSFVRPDPRISLVDVTGNPTHGFLATTQNLSF